ncbi:Aldo/keto reductase [Roridomyces roridus]|uniref:Aldo/keto reductase n=1 Tax=Roridomyces roridus TaxID=1738132 RepID=A0AAD7BCH7_9AGAR|nr:Aldo/keto reductase [Roridomyces roridus]
MASFAPPPPPVSKLGIYRTLSPLAGIRVSPIQLGGANIGDQWNAMAGEMTKESSFKLLDVYFDNGGNFIDTASNYQEGTSESYIGEWAEKRGIRDQLVIATKYTTNYVGTRQEITKKVNYVGNNVKSMYLSVEASLQKLRTTYIDILYVHWWDWETSTEEVMNGLHNLVVQGKVLYLGISNAPAWVVVKANEYARYHGKTPFVIYQGAWSVLERSFEREIIPMARAEGLAIAPWNVVGAGRIRTDVEEERRRTTGENGRTMFGPQWERTESEKKMSYALEKVAGELGAKSITAVAIAYVMQKVPYCFPIVGGRKVEHLLQNIEALDICLSQEQIEYLESIIPFDVGFPVSYIGDGTQHSFLMLLGGTGNLEKHPRLEPIRPAKK